MGEQRVAVDDEARIRASRDALEALIDEELAVQAAERAQLDRDPAVRTALDAARRAVLARAYLARAAGPRTPPPEAELRRYYDERPEFFAQRRSYRFRELALEADAALEALVRARLRDDADLEQLADWLHARGARFRAHGYAGAAELLPAGEARTLAEARPGDTRVLRDAGVLRIVQVIAIRSDPVEFAAARPLIEARLAEERARAAAEAELRRLKESARIVYAGAAAQPEGASVR